MENQETNPKPKDQSSAYQRRSDEKEFMGKFDSLNYQKRDESKQLDWFSQMFWGLFIALIGVLFLARSMGFAQGVEWRQFFSHIWPVFIIFFGLSVIGRGGVIAKIISALIMLGIMTFFVLWFFHVPVHFNVGQNQINFNPDTFDSWIMEKK